MKPERGDSNEGTGRMGIVRRSQYPQYHNAPTGRRRRRETDLGQLVGQVLERPRTPYRVRPWPREQKFEKYRSGGYLLRSRSLGRCPSQSSGCAVCVGTARSSRASASEDLPPLHTLPCHRRQRVLMAEGFSEPSTWPRVRATARALLTRPGLNY